MKLSNTHQFKKSLLVTSIAVALSACGSSGSMGDSKSFSGTVADGYLVDARVCLDLNDNKECDEGEPSAISSEGGEFTLEGVTQAQLDLHALVVEIIEGLTVDEDFPNQVIDEAYTMTAPAGYNFISPLTTMVQQELEENEGNDDFDVEDAEESVQAKLGTTLDLSEDFVAAKQDDSDFSEEEREQFEQLHKVAQVTARVLQDNVEAVTEAVDGTDVSFDQVLEMVVGEVLEALETINEQVEDAIDEGGEFDPDALAATEAITEEALIDTQEVDVEAELAAREAEKTASAANLMELVTSVGINWFDADHDEGELELFYGSFKHNLDANQSEEETFYYDPTSDSWVVDTDESNEGDYLLTESGWVQASDREEISISDDGTITIAHAEIPGYAEQLEATQFDIVDLNIASTLAMAGHDMAWAGAVDPLASFDAGAIGFTLTFTAMSNQYRMWDWDCNEEQVVGGMCNSVWMQVGDGDHSTDGQATTLASLLSAEPSNASQAGQVTGPQVAWMHDKSIFAEMLEDGHVNYYFTEWMSDGTSVADVIAEGTWGVEQVGEVTMYVMELPPVIVGEGDMDYEDRFIFFTEKDGYVRRGEFVPEGNVEHGEVVFNQTATTNILEAFNNSHFDQLSDEIAAHHEQELLEEQLLDESGVPGSSESSDSDGTVDESEQELPALETALQACEFDDSMDTTASGAIDFSTRADFNAAVLECGGSAAVTFNHIADKTFIVASQPNERLHFTANNQLFIIEELSDGTIQEDELSWELVEGELVVTEIDESGVVEQTSIVLLEANSVELSLKGFSEHVDDYLGGDMDGTMGEIWSDVIVEELSEESALL